MPRFRAVLKNSTLELCALAVALVTLGYVNLPRVVTYPRGPLDVRTPVIEQGQRPVIAGTRCYHDVVNDPFGIHEVHVTRTLVDADTGATTPLMDGYVKTHTGCEDFETTITDLPLRLSPGTYYITGEATPVWTIPPRISTTFWRSRTFRVEPSSNDAAPPDILKPAR